jgi:hypothetical protein
VRETQDEAGDDALNRQRQRDARERAKPGCAQCGRRFTQARIDLSEGSRDGLDRERQAVEHRCDDETLEGEGERMTRPLGPPSPERTARAHGHEQIEAKDCGR